MTQSAPAGESFEQQADRLVDAWVSDNTQDAKAACQLLANAPPQVTDPAARHLVKILKGGGPRAAAACEALMDKAAPQFGPHSYAKLLVALQRASEKGTQAASGVRLKAPSHASYRRKLEQARPPGSTLLPLRIASGFKQPWVLTVLLFSLVFGGVALSSGGQAAFYGGGALTAVLVAVVAADAFVRRCPSCRALWAASLRSRVSGGDGSRKESSASWQCVFCKHGWKTSRIL